MANGKSRPLLLIFSQTFVPDPASVGQHIADVAVEMARRGHRVRVYTSARGYEDPAVRYPQRENLRGVDVRRLSLASFGKKSMFTRALGTASFLAQCLWLGITTRDLGGIFFSTSPPLIGSAAVIAKFFRRVPIAYWAMDLNPDQLIAMGKIAPASLAARFLERVNRMVLRRSDLIVVLDRFMAERLFRRGDYQHKMLVMPPWPHEENLENVPPDANPFRQKHGLEGKFVIMYSGNHSPANPLATLLQAAIALKDDDRLRFVFVGGGLGKKEVEAAIRDHHLTNAFSLPYQPLAEIKYSLSAADVHVVSMGDNMVGIIHPCKIYGALAVGRPILYLGPQPSHIADLLAAHDLGLHVSHGDVPACIQALQTFLAMSPTDLARRGQLAQQVLQTSLSQSLLCTRLCDALQKSLALPALHPQAARPTV